MVFLDQKCEDLGTMFSALTECGLLISSYMGQRFSFENPMQAIDSLSRKMRLAKYMSTILQ